MATPQNRNKTSNPDSQAKQNYDATSLATRFGSFIMGLVSADSAVTSDVCIQASDGRHAINLDKDGPRKGCSQITAPGRISIQSGQDRQEAEDTLFINALNGNIDIIASNGKIRLQGTDIELIARGSGGSKGNIRMKASENIELDAKKVLVNATVMYKLATAGTAEIVANSAMTIYSSCIRGVTDAVANKNQNVVVKISKENKLKSKGENLCHVIRRCSIWWTSNGWCRTTSSTWSWSRRKNQRFNVCRSTNAGGKSRCL
jgi:hypothetical protein